MIVIWLLVLALNSLGYPTSFVHPAHSSTINLGKIFKSFPTPIRSIELTSKKLRTRGKSSFSSSNFLQAPKDSETYKWYPKSDKPSTFNKVTVDHIFEISLVPEIIALISYTGHYKILDLVNKSSLKASIKSILNNSMNRIRIDRELNELKGFFVGISNKTQKLPKNLTHKKLEALIILLKSDTFYHQFHTILQMLLNELYSDKEISMEDIRMFEYWAIEFGTIKGEILREKLLEAQELLCGDIVEGIFFKVAEDFLHEDCAYRILI